MAFFGSGTAGGNQSFGNRSFGGGAQHPYFSMVNQMGRPGQGMMAAGTTGGIDNWNANRGPSPWGGGIPPAATGGGAGNPVSGFQAGEWDNLPQGQLPGRRGPFKQPVQTMPVPDGAMPVVLPPVFSPTMGGEPMAVGPRRDLPGDGGYGSRPMLGKYQSTMGGTRDPLEVAMQQQNIFGPRGQHSQYLQQRKFGYI